MARAVREGSGPYSGSGTAYLSFSPVIVMRRTATVTTSATKSYHRPCGRHRPASTRWGGLNKSYISALLA